MMRPGTQRRGRIPLVTCAEIDWDRYGRTVATCAVGSQDIGAELVRQGWALDFECYSGGTYAAEQLEAEQAQRGLWSGSFIVAVGVARAMRESRQLYPLALWTS
jgi:endonuclease YncB( thermonuclease family)